MANVKDIINDLEFSWKMDSIYSHKLTLFEDDDVKEFCIPIIEKYHGMMVNNYYLQDEKQYDEDD